MPQTAGLNQIISDLRQQILYLQEIGVDSLDVSLPEIVPRSVVLHEDVNVQAVTAAASAEIVSKRPAIADDNEPYQSRLQSLPSLASRKIAPSRSARDPEGSSHISVSTEMEDANSTSPLTMGGQQIIAPDALVGDLAPALPEPVETIQQIRTEIGRDCMRCPLHALGRSQVVNSVGNFDADLMFVGEAPGADEDRLGEPFVGRAGQLLTQIIGAIGLKR